MLGAFFLRFCAISQPHSAVNAGVSSMGETGPGAGRMWPNGSRSRLVGLVWRPRMPRFDPLGGGGEELACHALPPCHMAAHGCINRPSQRAAVAQASGGSILGLATAVRAVSAALSSHDGDTLAAAPAALQLNGEGADDMRHSNMHMSGFDALLMQCAKRNSGAALVRC